MKSLIYAAAAVLFGSGISYAGESSVDSLNTSVSPTVLSETVVPGVSGADEADMPGTAKEPADKASAAFGDAEYICTSVSGDANAVIQYKVEFTHSFLSGNRVSFVLHNSAGNWDASILKDISIGDTPLMSMRPGPGSFGSDGVNYSGKRFLHIGDTDEASVLGETNGVYLSDSLIRQESSGLALYSHSSANFISIDKAYKALNCKRAQ